MYMDMLTLADVLSDKNEPLITVSSETPISEGCWYFEEYKVGSFLVEYEECISGIFTERDIPRVIASGMSPSDIKIGDVMSPHVIIGRVDESVEDALRAMAKSHIHHLPVVDDESIVGIVSMLDLVRLRYGTEAPKTEYLPSHSCPVCGTVSLHDGESHHHHHDHEQKTDRPIVRKHRTQAA